MIVDLELTPHARAALESVRLPDESDAELIVRLVVVHRRASVEQSVQTDDDVAQALVRLNRCASTKELAQVSGYGRATVLRSLKRLGARFAGYRRDTSGQSVPTYTVREIRR